MVLITHNYAEKTKVFIQLVKSQCYFIGDYKNKMMICYIDSEETFLDQEIINHQEKHILVRHSVQITQQTKTTIFSKANFLKNIRNKYLVKLESIFEQDGRLHMMYEYVQKKLSTVLQHAPFLFTHKIQAQLRQLTRFLANIGIRTLIEPERIGLSDKEEIKYFMGTNFNWDQSYDEHLLQEFYEKQVDAFMKPYLSVNKLGQSTNSNSENSIDSCSGNMNFLKRTSLNTCPSNRRKQATKDKNIKTEYSLNDLQADRESLQADSRYQVESMTNKMLEIRERNYNEIMSTKKQYLYDFLTVLQQNVCFVLQEQNQEQSPTQSLVKAKISKAICLEDRSKTNGRQLVETVRTIIQRSEKILDRLKQRR